MTSERDTLCEHFRQAATLVQEAKHNAQMRTAECAADADWDLETYWRARAEGLAEAERILRDHAAEAE